MFVLGTILPTMKNTGQIQKNYELKTNCLLQNI